MSPGHSPCKTSGGMKKKRYRGDSKDISVPLAYYLFTVLSLFAAMHWISENA